MKIAEELIVEQGSDEWFVARLPLVTSSELNNVLMDPKKAGYINYKAQIVLQTITGKMPERFKSKAMEWGNETEELAATMYTLATGNEVRTCGIFIHKWMKLGDSPDRMIVSQRGTLEIKCFNSANHLETLKSGHMPIKHKAQVQNHIQMTDSDWCDFVSFDPDFPVESQLFIERIYKDEAYCKKLTLEVSLFLDEVDADIKFLNEYKGKIWN